VAKAGDVFHVLGNTITMKVAATDSNGALAIFVEEVPSKAGVPLHVHKAAAETWFVLKGNFRVSVNGEIRELAEGDGLYFAPNVPRAFKNVGDRAAQLLFTVFPSGPEGFLEEISAGNFDPAVDLTEIIRIAAKYQLEIVGPPID
jgi:quercetin dioxygenase-like cupin family protein